MANVRSPGRSSRKISRREISLLDRQAGNVSARPGQRIDKARTDRISGRREYDWDCRYSSLCREGWGVPVGDNDIDLEPDELGCDFGDALVVPVRPSKLNRNGLVLGPAEFAKPLHKGGGPLASGRGRTSA
jgi:hypothetical protein